MEALDPFPSPDSNKFAEAVKRRVNQQVTSSLVLFVRTHFDQILAAKRAGASWAMIAAAASDVGMKTTSRSISSVFCREKSSRDMRSSAEEEGAVITPIQAETATPMESNNSFDGNKEESRRLATDVLEEAGPAYQEVPIDIAIKNGLSDNADGMVVKQISNDKNQNAEYPDLPLPRDGAAIENLNLDNRTVDIDGITYPLTGTFGGSMIIRLAGCEGNDAFVILPGDKRVSKSMVALGSIKPF